MQIVRGLIIAVVAVTALTAMSWATWFRDRGPSVVAYPVDDSVWTDCSAGYVALTFDDGPNETTTPKLQKVLAKEGIRATFFNIGESVKNQPELAQQVSKDGHVIGNHTWDHKDLPSMSVGAVKKELSRAKDAFKDAGLPEPFLFRPPGGSTTPEVAQIAQEQGMTEIGWTVDPEDWRDRAPAVLAVTALTVRSKGIVLLHDVGQQNVLGAMPLIAQGLRTKHMCPGRVVITPNETQKAWDGWDYHAEAGKW